MSEYYIYAVFYLYFLDAAPSELLCGDLVESQETGGTNHWDAYSSGGQGRGLGRHCCGILWL